MNAISKAANTSGAMRAARQIDELFGAWQTTVPSESDLAAIIDRETAAPEMLAALEAVMRFCPSFPGEVEVAVRKARGNQ